MILCNIQWKLSRKEVVKRQKPVIYLFRQEIREDKRYIIIFPSNTIDSNTLYREQTANERHLPCISADTLQSSQLNKQQIHFAHELKHTHTEANTQTRRC